MFITLNFKNKKGELVMPDITMCKGDGCPLKETCYRFKAEPSDRQAWFMEVPYKEDTKDCEHHWEEDDIIE
jgi:hypothetical protein